MTAALTIEPGIVADEWERIDRLCEDPEWVEAEFAAILAASGLTVSVAVEVPSTPGRIRHARAGASRLPRRAGVVIRMPGVERVRSPPTTDGPRCEQSSRSPLLAAWRAGGSSA